MALEFVTDDTAPAVASTNICLYGPPGTGKTTNALTAPGPVLYLNAEGPGRAAFAIRMHGRDHVREVRVNSKSVLKDAMLALKADKSKTFKSVVVDTLGEVYRVMVDEFAGEARPQVQDYGDAGIALERFVRFLRDLPVVVVLVAHEQTFDTPDGSILMPQAGGRALPQKVTGMMDYVGYTGVIPGEGENPDRYVAQLRPGHGRYAKDTGSLLGPVRDVNIAEWVEALAAATTKNGR